MGKGYKTVGGWVSQVLPLPKGGGDGKSCSNVEGGRDNKMFWSRFRTGPCFYHTEDDSNTKFKSLLREGHATGFGPAIFLFLSILTPAIPNVLVTVCIEDSLR